MDRLPELGRLRRPGHFALWAASSAVPGPLVVALAWHAGGLWGSAPLSSLCALFSDLLRPCFFLVFFFLGGGSVCPRLHTPNARRAASAYAASSAAGQVRGS